MACLEFVEGQAQSNPDFKYESKFLMLLCIDIITLHSASNHKLSEPHQADEIKSNAGNKWWLV